MRDEPLARVKSVALIVVLAACDSTLVDEDDIYTRGAPGLVLCGNTIDDKASASVDAIGGALALALSSIVLPHSTRPGAPRV